MNVQKIRFIFKCDVFRPAIKNDNWLYSPVTVQSVVKSYDPFQDQIWTSTPGSNQVEGSSPSQTGYSFFKGDEITGVGLCY